MIFLYNPTLSEEQIKSREEEQQARMLLPTPGQYPDGTTWTVLMPNKTYDYEQVNGAWFLQESAKTVKAPAKKIHSCKHCKQVNEFAEANQADGSYVCFECRR